MTREPLTKNMSRAAPSLSHSLHEAGTSNCPTPRRFDFYCQHQRAVDSSNSSENHSTMTTAPTGAQHASDMVERTAHVLHVMERHARDDRIPRFVGVKSPNGSRRYAGPSGAADPLPRS